MGLYIQPADLETALSPRTYVEIFADDTDTNTVSLTAVNQVIDRAEGLVDSYLIDGYYKYPLNPAIDRLLVSAALMFAQALAFTRHPEYVRTHGEVAKVELYKEATATMHRIQRATQRLPDVAKAGAKPLNVGGVVTDPGPILIGDCPGDF